MEVSLAAEQIGHIGKFPITNSLITTGIVSFGLISFSLIVSKKIALVPSGFQNTVEFIIEGLYSLCSQIAGKKTSFIFPWFATFFLFIIVSNWFGLLPGFGTIGIYEHGHLVPLLRPVNSDLNVTLALALISLTVTHFFSIKILGIKDYLGRFFSKNPINLFVGILEAFLEFVKIISLSFRLFGNVFAGETLLFTVAKLGTFTAFLIPLPFMILEIVVGFVQALVFSMLTLVFMVILTTSHKASH